MTLNYWNGEYYLDQDGEKKKWNSIVDVKCVVHKNTHGCKRKE